MTREQGQEEVNEKFEAVLSSIIQALHSRNEKDTVSLALYFLLVREANTWRSIRLLGQHTPAQFHDAFLVDAGTLLRAMFDAYLQGHLIFRDPAKRAELASQYLEFQHVERYKAANKATSHDNPLANILKASPNRPKGEERSQHEFDRVKDAFLVEQKKCDGTVKRGPATRSKWYKGDLFQLAKDAGKEAEYDIFMASFSGCVHSSALALGKGPLVPQEHVLDLASMLAARVARMNVEYNDLKLGDDRLILDEIGKSWFEKD